MTNLVKHLFSFTEKLINEEPLSRTDLKAHEKVFSKDKKHLRNIWNELKEKQAEDAKAEGIRLSKVLNVDKSFNSEYTEGTPAFMKKR